MRNTYGSFISRSFDQECLFSCSSISPKDGTICTGAVGVYLIPIDRNGNDMFKFCKNTPENLVPVEPEDVDVTSKIYNRAGEYPAEVVDDQSYAAGIHSQSWDGSVFQAEVESGVLIPHFEIVPENQEHKPIKVVKNALSQGGGS